MNVLMKFVISIILSFAFSFFEYDDMHPVTRGEFLRCPNCANPQMQVRYQLLSSVNFRGIDIVSPTMPIKFPTQTPTNIGWFCGCIVDFPSGLQFKVGCMFDFFIYKDLR